MTTIKPRSKTTEVSNKPSVAKTSTKKTQSKARAIPIEMRMQMIREAAYYRAEKRGFSPQGAELDWYEAEKEIEQLIHFDLL